MPETIKVIIESIPKESSSIFNNTNMILTLLIAMIATYIGFQQWRLSKNKLKYDLFEKRYAVYSLINSVVSNLRHKDDPFSIKISDDEIYTYLDKVDSYVFLFNNDVKDIIDELNNNLNKYLFNYELMNLLERESIDKYYAKKENLYYLNDEVEHFSDYFHSLEHEKQDEFIMEEFEKMEFENTALYHIENIEKNYRTFIKQIDKYINFKKVL